MILWRILFPWLSALVLLIVAPALAHASYPGGAGTIAYQDSYSSWDPLNNGAVTYEYSIGTGAPTYHTGSLITCSGSDSGFFNGTQFCAQSGVGFSPDGLDLVFAGVEYQADGSSMPDQSDSSCSGSAIPRCPEAIILANSNGSSPRLLGTGIADSEHPGFMPDGQHVVFAGRAGPRTPFNLYTAGLDGTGVTQLTTDGGTDPAPCPNGSIVYVHDGDLYLLGADLQTRRRLTYRGGSLPDCSRDSGAIAFLRHSTLYTIRPNGKQLRRLSTLGVADGRPAFSPSGGRIAFTTTRRCTSHCGARYPGCTNLTDRLEVIDLRGRLRRSWQIGSNACSSDGDLGGNQPGDVAWQPLR